MIPIYKAHNRSHFTNYRPISLLSNFTKCFEKVICYRMIEFAEQYLTIIPGAQMGFESIAHEAEVRMGY